MEYPLVPSRACSGSKLPMEAISLQHGLAVKISGFGEYLTPDHPLIGYIVPAYYDFVESSRLSLHYPQLYIHRISRYIGLDRDYVEEYVSLVGIQCMDVHELLLGVTEEPLLQVDDIVHVPFVYHQDTAQLLRCIERVSRPYDIPEIVSFALVYYELYTETVLLHIIYRVLHDTRVPESRLIEDTDQGLLVVLVLLLVELLCLEDIADTHVARLGHRSDQLALRHMIITLERDGLYLHLGLAVHPESHPDSILDHGVAHLDDIHFSIVETLLLEIVLYDPDRRPEQIVGQRDITPEIEPFLKICLLRVLYTLKVPP